ncbi:MAG: pseudouridine synthase, partial [Acidobacteria bacterium]
MTGLLIIDKPVGLTSHDVVGRVRHILHERRVGHTGTLDPFATGVLIVLVG